MLCGDRLKPQSEAVIPSIVPESASYAQGYAHALFAVIVLTSGLGAPVPAPWLIFIDFFVVLLVGSALLFRQAAREQGGTSDRPGNDEL